MDNKIQQFNVLPLLNPSIVQDKCVNQVVIDPE